MDSIQLKQERDPKYGKYDNPNEEVTALPVEDESENNIQEAEPMTLVKEEMPENITLEEEEPNQIVDEKPLPPVVPVIQNEPVSEPVLLVEKPKTRRIRRKSSIKTKSVTQKKRKRCKKGSRRNRKTKRCRRKCEPGYKKNKSNRCVKA
jgi:hypothetical protein